MEMAFGPGGLSSAGGNGGPGSGHQRTKRMRTSFKHHQLRTMKSYFHHNHNPDAKDLKQLSQKTGLPKRVLQVNFVSDNMIDAIYTVLRDYGLTISLTAAVFFFYIFQTQHFFSIKINYMY